MKRFAYLDVPLSAAASDLWASEPVTVEDFDGTGHPNALPFKGTLLLVDQPSDKAPNGSHGHLIMVPKSVAEKLLPTLVGMGVNYSTEFDHHEPQKKIGVITAAWISGEKVKVRGIIYARDFPEAAKAIQANSPELGMSMELSDIWVEDADAQVWKLQDFKFTGGTILKRSAAAYHHTSLAAQGWKGLYLQALAAASAVVDGKLPEREKNMAKVHHSSHGSHDEREKRMLKTVAAAASAGVAASIGKSLEEITSAIAEQTKLLAAVAKSLPSTSVTDSSDASDMSAAAKKSGKGGADASPSEASPSEPSEPSEASVTAAAKKGGKGGADASPSEASPSEPSDVSAAADDELTAAKGRRQASDASDISAKGRRRSSSSDASSVHAFDASDPHGESDASDEEPGEVNKSADKHFKKHSKEGISAAIAELRAAAETVRHSAKKEAKYKEQVKRLSHQVESLQAQVELAARHTGRVTLPAEAYALLEKGGVNIAELQSEGKKLTWGQVDSILSADPKLNLDPATRMGIKNALLQQGLVHDTASN